jgi:hypothetical protein
MVVTFEERDGGTEVTILFENIPPGIRPEDNDAGTRSSLEKLARYIEPGKRKLQLTRKPEIEGDPLRFCLLELSASRCLQALHLTWAGLWGKYRAWLLRA